MARRIIDQGHCPQSKGNVMIQHLFRLSLVLFAALSFTHSVKATLLFTAVLYVPYLLAIHAKQIEAYINSPRLLLADTWYKSHALRRFVTTFASLLFLNPAFLGMPFFGIPPYSLLAFLVGVAIAWLANSSAYRWLNWLPNLHWIYEVPTILVSPIIKRYEDFIAWPVGMLCGTVVLVVFFHFAPMGYGIALFAEFVAMWAVITVLMACLHLVSKLNPMQNKPTAR